MLTVILLVLLGGGAGLLAIGLVEPGSLPRLRLPEVGSLRRRPARTTAPPATPSAPRVDLEPVVAPSLPGPQPRRRRGDVPKAFTAVEGSYREVAVAPWWRKVVSLALLLVVLLATGLVLAAVTGAVLGLAAELVDGAVG